MNNTYNPRLSIETLTTVWCIISALVLLAQTYEVFRPATGLNWIATVMGIVFIGVMLALAGYFERKFGEAGLI